MRKIKLTQGKYAIVDDEDYERVSQYKWYANRIGSNIYAVRSEGGRVNRKFIFLHRFIIDAPKNSMVDHINRNGLDCRRENLRFATKSQNMRNRGPNANNSSGFKGVSWDGKRRKWQANITIQGKQIGLGRYETAREAAHAYDDAARKYHGEFAWTNFEGAD